MSKFLRQHRVSKIDPAAKHGFPGSTEFAHPTGCAEHPEAREGVADHQQDEGRLRDDRAPWSRVQVE
jgi:hypothetical protein